MYEGFLDFSSSGKGIAWTINGQRFLVDPRSRQRFGQYQEAPVAQFLRSRVRPNAICFDVGANVGLYVLQFARWSEPDGKVIAFEPNSDAREILEKHIRFNGLQSRVQVVPAAVGAETGVATLYKAGADGMGRLGSPNELIADHVTEQTVPVITLDAFCAETGLMPDCILLDIEGFEFVALKGAKGLLRRGRGRLEIIVEMHPDIWNSAATSRSDVEAFLGEFHLRAEPLTGQKDPLSDYGIVHLAYE